LLLVIVSFPIQIYAQNSANFFTDTTQQLSVYMGANYTYGSSVMNSEFVNKFLFGGKIDRDLKDEAYAKLNNNNRLGGDLNYKLNVEIPFDTIFRRQNISLLIGLEYNEHMDASFTSDLFKFTFDGNKQFAGSNADIGQTNYNYYKYQQLNIGFINYKFSEDRLAKEGVVVSIIKGEEHKAITVPEGTIFTEELGRKIDINIDYIYNSSDTANKGFKAFNGWGVSTDLFTEFFLKNGDKIYLGVEDLGFIHWNKNSLEISADSLYHFEGLIVDNIFDLNDSVINKISKDSIINSISNQNKKADYSIALPTAIHINYTKELSNTSKIDVGVYYKILSNYSPLIYANYYHYFNEKFLAKTQVSYGGYGKINLGIALAKSFGNYFNIFIGTNNIESFIVPNMSYSNSGFIGLKKYF
jgi:hypothetical protein